MFSSPASRRSNSSMSNVESSMSSMSVNSTSSIGSMNELRASGLNFDVQYVGYCPVNVSIASIPEATRSDLLRYCIVKCFALHKNEDPPEPDEILEPMVGPPKITNKQVVLNINYKYITTIHNDPSDPDKNGKLMQKYPIKYTSIIEAVDAIPGSIGYISKKMSGLERRCLVYSIRNKGMSGILTTIQNCLRLSMEEEGGAVCHSPVSPPFLTPPDTPDITPPVTPPLLKRNPPPVTPRRTAPQPPPRPSAPRNVVMGKIAPSLMQYQWYHGVLPRLVAEQRIQNPGDFLVRESTHLVSKLVLTCKVDRGTVLHILPVAESGVVETEDAIFSSVEDLIDHYLTTKKALRYPGANGMLLLNPIDRRDFLLNENIVH